MGGPFTRCADLLRHRSIKSRVGDGAQFLKRNDGTDFQAESIYMRESEKRHYENAQSMSLAEAESVLNGLASLFFPADSSTRQFPLDLAEGESPRQVVQLPNIEARYRTLVEQIPAVVFMAFLDEGISEAYVSPQIEEMLGFTQEEWRNDPVRWYWHIHPDDRGRWNIEAAQMFLFGRVTTICIPSDRSRWARNLVSL